MVGKLGMLVDGCGWIKMWSLLIGSVKNCATKLALAQNSWKDETGMYSKKSSVAMPVIVPPENQ